MVDENGGSNGSNGDLSERDVRLAEAIGAAVSGALVPAIGNVTRAVETLQGEVATMRGEIVALRVEIVPRLDRLQAGAAGIGRMVALEERVSAIERKLKS